MPESLSAVVSCNLAVMKATTMSEMCIMCALIKLLAECSRNRMWGRRGIGMPYETTNEIFKLSSPFDGWASLCVTAARDHSDPADATSCSS